MVSINNIDSKGRNQNDGTSGLGQASLTPAPTQRSLLQLMFVYPTLAISLFGAIPAYFEKFQAWKADENQDRYQVLKSRNDKFERNIDCLKQPANAVETKTNGRVEFTVCDATGDLYVKFVWGTSSDQSRIDFISKADLPRRDGHTGSNWELIPSAKAQMTQFVQNSRETIVCQKFIREGLLLQHVRTPAGACFEQTLNTYRGMVESRRQIPCGRPC
jgi:hypothetical protein